MAYMSMKSHGGTRPRVTVADPLVYELSRSICGLPLALHMTTLSKWNTAFMKDFINVLCWRWLGRKEATQSATNWFREQSDFIIIVMKFYNSYSTCCKCFISDYNVNILFGIIVLDLKSCGAPKSNKEQVKNKTEMFDLVLKERPSVTCKP